MIPELPQDWLVGPTTFREYTDRLLGQLDTVSPKLMAQVEKRAAEVAVMLQPGDVLWEWHQDCGPLSSEGGLAVLRGGKVVAWWREWAS